MATITLTIPANVLGFAWDAVNEDDIRYYLAGVHVAYSAETNRMVVEGTNGRALARAFFEHSNAEKGIAMPTIDGDKPTESFDFIMPIVSTIRKNYSTVTITLEADSIGDRIQSGQITMGFANRKGEIVSTDTVRAIEGVYPDTDKVMPDENQKSKSKKDKFVGFNPIYFKPLERIMDHDRGTYVKISEAGDGMLCSPDHPDDEYVGYDAILMVMPLMHREPAPVKSLYLNK